MPLSSLTGKEALALLPTSTGDEVETYAAHGAMPPGLGIDPATGSTAGQQRLPCRTRCACCHAGAVTGTPSAQMPHPQSFSVAARSGQRVFLAPLVISVIPPKPMVPQRCKGRWDPNRPAMRQVEYDPVVVAAQAEVTAAPRVSRGPVDVYSVAPVRERALFAGRRAAISRLCCRPCRPG